MNHLYYSFVSSRQYLNGQVQWGSKYQTSLLFKWLKVVWLPNGPIFECHLNTEQPGHLRFKSIYLVLYKIKWIIIIWKPKKWQPFWMFCLQMVRTIAQPFKTGHSGQFQMVGTKPIAWPFENQTIWIPNTKMFPVFECPILRSPLYTLLTRTFCR